MEREGELRRMRRRHEGIGLGLGLGLKIWGDLVCRFEGCATVALLQCYDAMRLG